PHPSERRQILAQRRSDPRQRHSSGQKLQFHLRTRPLRHAETQTVKRNLYNKKAVIRKFEKDANYKHSYAYNIIVLDFGDKHKYWCDVRGALDNSELMGLVPLADNTPPPATTQPTKKPASTVVF